MKQALQGFLSLLTVVLMISNVGLAIAAVTTNPTNPDSKKAMNKAIKKREKLAAKVYGAAGLGFLCAFLTKNTYLMIAHGVIGVLCVLTVIILNNRKKEKEAAHYMEVRKQKLVADIAPGAVAAAGAVAVIATAPVSLPAAAAVGAATAAGTAGAHVAKKVIHQDLKDNDDTALYDSSEIAATADKVGDSFTKVVTHEDNVVSEEKYGAFLNLAKNLYMQGRFKDICNHGLQQQSQVTQLYGQLPDKEKSAMIKQNIQSLPDNVRKEYTDWVKSTHPSRDGKLSATIHLLDAYNQSLLETAPQPVQQSSSQAVFDSPYQEITQNNRKVENEW